MLTTTLALAFACLPAAFGQTTYNVEVAQNGQLAFNPQFVNAKQGDIINLMFNPVAHTFTESSFDYPCVPATGGFDTGFVNVSAGQAPVSRQFVVPQDTTPLWYYCRQIGHCGKGMVFAINPPTTGNTFSNFLALAIAQNGTGSSAVTVPPPVYATATATVTWESSTYTTTYTSYAGTPPPTPAAKPVTHTITVGNNGILAFNPPNISASIGDTVEFQFHPKNHTVTQSNFLNPCENLQKSTGVTGFDSGFNFAVTSNATTFPTFSIKVNDTAPIWGYCRQTGHCSQGMVFAINAVESGPNNFEAFTALALATASNSSTNSSTTGTSSTAPSSTAKSGARVATSVSVGLTSVLAVVGIVALAL